MSGMVFPSGVKSVQAIAVTLAAGTTSNAATIGSVNPAKTIVVTRGMRSQVGETNYDAARDGRWNVSSATSVEYSRNLGVVTSLNVDYFAYVVEFY